MIYFNSFNVNNLSKKEINAMDFKDEKINYLLNKKDFFLNFYVLFDSFFNYINGENNFISFLIEKKRKMLI